MKRSFFLSIGAAAIVVAVLSTAAFSANPAGTPQAGNAAKVVCCCTDCTCGDACGCAAKCTDTTACKDKCCVKGCCTKSSDAKTSMKCCAAGETRTSGMAKGCKTGSAAQGKGSETGKKADACPCGQKRADAVKTK